MLARSTRPHVPRTVRPRGAAARGLRQRIADHQCRRIGEASEPAEPEPNELLVLEWSGYEAPDFWTDFAERQSGH